MEEPEARSAPVEPLLKALTRRSLGEVVEEGATPDPEHMVGPEVNHPSTVNHLMAVGQAASGISKVEQADRAVVAEVMSP